MTISETDLTSLPSLPTKINTQYNKYTWSLIFSMRLFIIFLRIGYVYLKPILDSVNSIPTKSNMKKLQDQIWSLISNQITSRVFRNPDNWNWF